MGGCIICLLRALTRLARHRCTAPASGVFPLNCRADKDLLGKFYARFDRGSMDGHIGRFIAFDGAEGDQEYIFRADNGEEIAVSSKKPKMTPVSRLRGELAMARYDITTGMKCTVLTQLVPTILIVFGMRLLVFAGILLGRLRLADAMDKAFDAFAFKP